MAAATGVSALDAVLVWGGVLAAAAGAGTVLWRTLRGVLRGARRVGQLVDDLLGEPARAGSEARPGLMERVSGLESGMAEVRAELDTNGGESLRDAVNRIDRRTAWIETAETSGETAREHT